MKNKTKHPVKTAAELDRQADLHLAFQYGQDSITDINPLRVKLDFYDKFGGDIEAEAEYDKGVKLEIAKKEAKIKNKSNLS
ncbi:MAG: hypothetical protein ACD_84C00038G0004 [uncultured bacterium]|nr:MAG: hypothetical protein ACD_84C00038G0004 [uncultured bacterium]